MAPPLSPQPLSRDGGKVRTDLAPSGPISDPLVQRLPCLDLNVGLPVQPCARFTLQAGGLCEGLLPLRVCASIWICSSTADLLALRTTTSWQCLLSSVLYGLPQLRSCFDRARVLSAPAEARGRPHSERRHAGSEEPVMRHRATSQGFLVGLPDQPRCAASERLTTADGGRGLNDDRVRSLGGRRRSRTRRRRDGDQDQTQTHSRTQEQGDEGRREGKGRDSLRGGRFQRR